MKRYDVHIVYMNGSCETVPKVNFVTDDQGIALRMDVKKYTDLPHDTEVKHIASVPYTAMRKWIVEEVKDS